MLLMALCIGSCKNTKEKEIVYNDKIQDTFFGATFGASKEDVVKAICNHSFAYQSSLFDEDTRQSFIKIDTNTHTTVERFSFGNMLWEMLDVWYCNNLFHQIRFMNAHKSKESALRNFENVLSTVSSKYHLYEPSIDDTNTYRLFEGKTNEGLWVSISCFRYESISYDIYVGVDLSYGDNNYTSVSNEL